MHNETKEESVKLLVAETAPEATENQAAADAQPAMAAQQGDDAASQNMLAEMDRRIRDLEAAIGDLRTVNAAAAREQQELAGRKTAGHAPRLMSKAGGPNEGNAAVGIDAALRGLSPEQRMAVKSGLLRAGVL